MLRSIANHFNETVFRGPDMEGDGGAPEDTTIEGGDAGGAEEPGEPSEESSEGDKPLSVREELKKTIAEARAADEGKSPKAPKAKVKAAPAAPTAPQAPPPASAIAAPTSLAKEAKAEWDKVPRTVQEAFVKREQDMAAGVQELKNKYDQIEQALAPHADSLRQMNASPGEAVNRLFLWFKALANSPDQAFPALAKNMGFDLAKLVSGQAQPAPAAGQPGAPAPTEIPEPVKNYVGQLENHVKRLTDYVNNLGGQFGSIQNNFNQESERKTRENLSIWSTGKEFFEDVRQDMAKMIETGMVPLKDGQVDLDTAYERAIHFNPEVRAKVLAKQQQANTEAQQQQQQAATTANATQVNKAKKAAVSLPTSNAPGVGNGQRVVKKQPGQRTSVRDSLKAAIADLRDQ